MSWHRILQIQDKYKKLGFFLINDHFRSRCEIIPKYQSIIMQLEKLREKREMTFNPFTTNFYTASFFLNYIIN